MISHLCAITLALFLIGNNQPQDDQLAISSLLDEFLSKVDQKEMHNRFWADDLIYTSSSGARFGKETIMSGFATDLKEEDLEEAKTSYSAEDVNIRIFDNMALLTFRLVAKTIQSDSVVVNNYLNSGTLIKRKEAWKVINWHATKTAE